MTLSSETLLLDHYHCTFFLPLIGVTDKDFQPGESFAWSYQTEAICLQEEAEEFQADHDSETAKARESEAARIREIEAQAYRYFSPAIRDILFDVAASPGPEKNRYTALEALKEWRIPAETLASWELHLGKEKDKDKEETGPLEYQIAKVTAVTLYRYFNGIYLLAFRVEPKALAQIPDDSPLFCAEGPGDLADIVLRDPANKEYYEQLQLESWLHFTRLARLIYPSFPQQNDEKKIVPVRLFIDGKVVAPAFEKSQKVRILEKPGEDISPVIRYLLKVFARRPETLDHFFDHYTNIYDDRMFVSVAYGLAGKQRPAEQLKRLFYLALYVDRHAETFPDMAGHAYTPEVIERLTQARTLDLWNGLGGYYGCTEFSNACLYRGEGFRSYIAPEHIPYIYDRMLIQALFYQASLRHYDDNICRETQKLLTKNDLGSIREQRGAFIRFTNQFWFHDLTEQMQGKAIFNLQQETLGLKKHYDIIKDELERTDEYLQTEHDVRIANLTSTLTCWGFVIAIFALYYAAFPLVSADLKDSVWAWWSGFSSCFDIIPKDVYKLLIIPVILIVVVRTFFWFGSKIRSCWSRRKR